MSDLCTKNNDIYISVIIPVFNAEPYLDQALESLHLQEYTPIEFICVNDGSTDNSLLIIKNYAQKDSRFKIIDKENEGYGASCNKGIARAVGTYISIFEPDDWIEGELYGDLASYIDTFSQDIDIAKTPYWSIVDPDTTEEQKVNCKYRNLVKPASQPFKISDGVILLRRHPSIWSALYRKEFLDSHQITFKEYPGAGWADNPFFTETMCRAQTIVYLDAPYYCYREETPEKARNFSQNNPLLPFDRWQEMLDIIEDIGITDEGILSAHYCRGFLYAKGVMEHVGLQDGILDKALLDMFKRMKPELVFRDPTISPHLKELFAATLAIPLPKLNKLDHYKHLAKESLYLAKTLGIKNMFGTLISFFKRRKAREGRA